MNRRMAALGWVSGLVLLAFAVSFIFSGLLALPRRLFLIPYVSLGAAFSYAFFRWARLDVGRLLRRRWRTGLIGAAVIAAISVGTVLSQPASAVAIGWRLAFDMLWSGLAYGVMDALLLSVLPVLIVGQVLKEQAGGAKGGSVLVLRVAGVALSLLVTAVYHLGFVEYRGPQVLGAMLGNGVVTLGYVMTGAPVAPLLGHVVLHLAALLHGPGSVAQLPPHL